VPMILAGFKLLEVGMPARYLAGFVFDLEGVGVWAGRSLALGCAILLNARFWGSVLKRLGPNRTHSRPYDTRDGQLRAAASAFLRTSVLAQNHASPKKQRILTASAVHLVGL